MMTGVSGGGLLVMVALGAGIGVALFTLLVRLVPPRTSLVVQLGRYDASRDRARRRTGPTLAVTSAAPAADGARTSLSQALARRVATVLAERGIDRPHLRQDLALTGRTWQALVARQLVGGFAGLVLGLVTAAAVIQLTVFGSSAGIAEASGEVVGGGGGVPASVLAAGVVAALMAVVFALIPELEVRREAGRRRQDFRRALGAYLDLVALEMAGSAAPTEALPSAARVGSGWPLVLIRHTLARATLAGQDPWQALTDLGERIGVVELTDLAGLIQLVGRDGARVRTTLTGRAASIRRRDLADAQGLAGQRDQSLLIAQTLIGLGFVAFVGYPAVVNLTAL